MKYILLLLTALTVCLTSCQKSGAELLENCHCNNQVFYFPDSNYVLAIPHYFSPNNDGHNDVIGAYANGVTGYSFTVSDDDGNQSTGDFWDGKFGSTEAPVGEYDFTVSVSFQNGRDTTVSGKFCLIRDCISDGLKNNPDCFMGEQFTGAGFSSSVPNGDADYPICD